MVPSPSRSSDRRRPCHCVPIVPAQTNNPKRFSALRWNRYCSGCSRGGWEPQQGAPEAAHRARSKALAHAECHRHGTRQPRCPVAFDRAIGYVTARCLLAAFFRDRQAGRLRQPWWTRRQRFTCCSNFINRISGGFCILFRTCVEST